MKPGIHWFSAGMHQVAPEADWLEQELAHRLAKLPYTKRRDEARLGRWTAKRTIAHAINIEPDLAALQQITIRNASDGAPEAMVDGEPLDAVIAMTDRADWAVCAVMAGRHRIGCDLELVEPRTGAFVRDYFTGSEQQLVASSGDHDMTANLIWSAKESALKVMRTGLRRDTRSVEVELFEAEQNDWRQLRITADDGRRFPGWWIQFGSFLLTVASEVETPPPASLAHPEPLRTALPGHAWMSDPYHLPDN